MCSSYLKIPMHASLTVSRRTLKSCNLKWLSHLGNGGWASELRGPQWYGMMIIYFNFPRASIRIWSNLYNNLFSKKSMISKWKPAVKNEATRLIIPMMSAVPKSVSWCAWRNQKHFWRERKRNTSYSVVPRTITKTLALSKNKNRSTFVILWLCNLWWSQRDKKTDDAMIMKNIDCWFHFSAISTTFSNVYFKST